ncbi:MAG: hypothetical protein WB643_08445, partial [Candidatus Bathyarchaeia archaeon]
MLAVFGALFGLVAIAALTIDVYMVLWLIFFKLFFMVAEWLLAYMNIYRLDNFEGRTRYEKYENPRIRPSFGRKNGKSVYKWLAALAIMVIIVFSGLMLWQTQAASRVNNASAFNQMLTFEPAGTPLFQHEIPNNMLRLTTEELAKSIALRSAAHFGSVKVGSAHITIY